MDLSLKRLLWRYDAGYFLKELIRDRFNYEKASLLSLRRKMNLVHLSGEHKDIELSITAQFEQQMRVADSSIRRSEFRDALGAFTKADDLLGTLVRAEEAVAVIQQGKEMLTCLKDCVPVQIEQFSSLDLLLATAKNEFQKGHYRSSQTIGNVCVEYARALLSTNEDGASAPTSKLSEQLQSYER